MLGDEKACWLKYIEDAKGNRENGICKKDLIWAGDQRWRSDGGWKLVLDLAKYGSIDKRDAKYNFYWMVKRDVKMCCGI